MPTQRPRRLLHLLLSTDSGRALPIVMEQQRSGAGRPVMVLGPAAADLTIPAGVEVRVLGNEFDERALLTLIYESDSVTVW